MKAFWMNPDNVVYAANDSEGAKQLYETATGEAVDEFYPQEITDAELDTLQIKHDSYGNPTAERTSIREYLNTAISRGFLCGMFL